MIHLWGFLLFLTTLASPFSEFISFSLWVFVLNQTFHFFVFLFWLGLVLRLSVKHWWVLGQKDNTQSWSSNKWFPRGLKRPQKRQCVFTQDTIGKGVSWVWMNGRHCMHFEEQIMFRLSYGFSANSSHRKGCLSAGGSGECSKMMSKHWGSLLWKGMVWKLT